MGVERGAGAEVGKISPRRCYIFSGGFTREADYEADRVDKPTILLDLTQLVELITQYDD